MIPYINIHTHHNPVSSDELGVFNCNYDDVVVECCSVGIHPYLSVYATEDKEFIGRSMQELERKSLRPEVVAIGESGLDATRGASLSIQMELFKQQIMVAEKTGKFLIIHCVKRYDEVIQLRKQMCPRQKWILHGFRKGQYLARQLINQGIDLSFGHYYNEEAVKLAYETGSLWLETDEREMDIREHYNEIAKVLGISVDELKFNIIDRASQLSSKFHQA